VLGFLNVIYVRKVHIGVLYFLLSLLGDMNVFKLPISGSCPRYARV